ncbi:MAG: FG-GAP-like repeat-containing protein [Verrucomicrobiota bacterium]
MKNTIFVRAVVAFMLGATCPTLSAAGLTFQPQQTFTGSKLDGWQPLGGARWLAREGEIVGAVQGGLVGVLLSEKKLQDVAIHLEFQSIPTVEVGVLLRFEPTADGFKSVLVAVKNGEVESYQVAFDSQLKETKRELLRSIGSDPLVRIADANTPRRESGARSNRRDSRPNDPAKPLVRPDTAFRTNNWNELEVFLDVNVLRAFLNDGSPTAVGATDSTGFGPLALYVAGEGEVRFKNVAFRDAAVRELPREQSSERFTVQRISDMFYSWAAAAGDFNRDGQTDVVAGPYIYFGPDFARSREIFPATTLNPSRAFPEINCQYAFDANGDGWPDIVTGPPRATLYLNPKGEPRRWDKFVVIPQIQSEVTVLKDIDGSGIPALVYCAEGTVRFAKPDPQNPTNTWKEYAVSERGFGMAHGIGAGDINGDGRIDILNLNGWWEQPAASATNSPWAYHPVAFARYGHRASGAGGAVIGVYDVNGDGLNDVVTSLNAHGFGLAWFEQKRDATGAISFVRHMIADDYASTNASGVTFSQAHGATYADLDGDGVLDFIVGKRYWSHLDSYFDPDPYNAPVLYCFRTKRNSTAPGGAAFVPELIHNRSGAGSDVSAVDLNLDGAIDVITSTDRGTFIFWNKLKDAERTPNSSQANR